MCDTSTEAVAKRVRMLRNGAVANLNILLEADLLEALVMERDELRFKLGLLADLSEIFGMSWSEFNVIGDKKSITEVARIENRSAQLEDYQKAFENRISCIRAEYEDVFFRAENEAITAKFRSHLEASKTT